MQFSGNYLNEKSDLFRCIMPDQPFYRKLLFRIEFEKKGDVLVSKTKLPEGDGYNVVVQFKQTTDRAQLSGPPGVLVVGLV